MTRGAVVELLLDHPGLMVKRESIEMRSGVESIASMLR